MKKIKKEITFIYMDAAEHAIYEPIAIEAQKRGYKVRFTDDKFAKCEIGFYCQHVNFPQFSKFSVIMLHDIIQQYGNWPDLWIREPWNKYDIGFLPSIQWVNNWNQCSQWYYANPKLGIYQIGWPKADKYAKVDRVAYKKEFNQKYHLSDSKRTILYAPSWENDNKQDDFVQAMLRLDVNIIIKQYPADSKVMPEQAYEIKRMYEMHKDNPRVTIIDPKTNIIEAIMGCDVLVSEESSTMCEAVMMGIPAISVSNWLIPDVTPKRLPECNYSFVFMTKKEALSDYVANLLENYDEILNEVDSFRKETFGNIGFASKTIMDIIDDCVNGNQIRKKSLKSAKRQMVPLKKYLFHEYEVVNREIFGNYCKRYKAINTLYTMAKSIKKKIQGKK